MLDHLGQSKRTHSCGELRREHVGQTVTLMGWVNSYRDHGSLLFIHLRDRDGIAQIVFREEIDARLLERARQARSEYVLAVTGELVLRTEENYNPNMATGEVEVLASELKILNDSQTPPFEIDNCKAAEDLRLKYRYLDLRRPEMQRNFKLRHELTLAARRALDAQGFYEIETPILTKSTPEGARDYLVPSRTFPGKFFALPQSPQLFKQLLMISGYDRYFQIARCFRDEDLRADRQPEFTQIDIEMSFVQPDDVFAAIEPLIVELFKSAGVEPPATPFPRMPYVEAMNRFGSDKPDLRFGLEFVDLSAQFEGGAFAVFADAVKKGGAVKGVAVPVAANWSRKQFDDIVEHAKKHGAGGLAYIQVLEGESKSALTKSLGAEGVNAVIAAAGAKAGDAILMIGGKWDVACNALGQVRLEVARREKLIKEAENRLLWVVDFPMFEYHEDDKRWYAMHHPFTSPVEEDLDKLESDPGSVRAKAYDLVFNGNELGGGSIRIHRSDVQSKVFKALGMSEEEAREKFGFFLDALSYGTPPHGGIAIGLDRTAMLFAKAKSLRDVIAFPKVASGSDLMTDSPSAVAPAQLAELKIKSLA
ncbi:MAG TPA: aspartate--tRNA ligase [Blastocatellia bacterium]|jgi:aspartyl-tRNA synthetase|nr:aspartate--tRNA ligase [Blastocatellia bacterium]